MSRGVVLMLAAAALGVSPAAAFAQAPTGDSVVGNLIDASGPAALIDARSGPSGENASGTARFGYADGSSFPPLWELNVTCVSVTGKTAVIGFSGRVSFPTTEEVRRTAGLIRIVDGGGPASGQDRAEFASVEGPFDGPPIPGPTTCSSYPGPYSIPHGPIVNSRAGDLVVTDAQALPTMQAECKNGGWRNYPGFKSQGECIRFVRGKGRQACRSERARLGVPAFRAKYGTGVPKRYAMRTCVARRVGP